MHVQAPTEKTILNNTTDIHGRRGTSEFLEVVEDNFNVFRSGKSILSDRGCLYSAR